MKKTIPLKIVLAMMAIAFAAGCASVVDSLNTSHQNLAESAKESPVAIHKDDVKPIPASSFEPKPYEPAQP